MNKLAHDNVNALLDRQKQAWLTGSRPDVGELLKDSALPPNAELLLDMLYNEIVVREEIGEAPAIDEYVRRFPHLEEDLTNLFEVHRAVNDRLQIETSRSVDGNAVIEGDLACAGPSLADYEILGELGRGGMGVVYKARHRRLKRLVALKMFEPGRRPSRRELARFRSEAEAIARLQHPHIVQIFEVGQQEDRPFLALELAEQGTLAERLQDLPFVPRAAAELLETLARAMQHAHEQHIVHRDLKPANVLFTKDGFAKITDFGLAKLLIEEKDRDMTRTGEPVGTPRYMAPEQADGQPEKIGPATDVYALGTILYECFTGQVPFVSASVVETIDKIRHDEPVPPRRLQRSIPRDLETICLTCLHKQPARRYASAEALANDLRRFLSGEPILARRTPPWERVWMWCRRRPALATLLGASATLCVAGLILLWVRQRIEDERLPKLRAAATQLTREGQVALSAKDVPGAKERFLAAMQLVRGEPALRDLELGVRGWLDQSMRDGEEQRFRQRQPPPLFDVLRDEAMVVGLVLAVQEPESIQAARDAIRAALALTLADDPIWRHEREQLALLDADMLFRLQGAAAALERLDQEKEISSRQCRLRRADYLERLHRSPEADVERAAAQAQPVQSALCHFWNAAERIRTADHAGAILDLDKTLKIEPDSFAARFLQAVCFLQIKRPTEAKIGLTACVAQRPAFAWNHYFRGQAYLQLGERDLAAEDFQHALDMNLREPARTYVGRALEAIGSKVNTEAKSE